VKNPDCEILRKVAYRTEAVRGAGTGGKDCLSLVVSCRIPATGGLFSRHRVRQVQRCAVCLSDRRCRFVGWSVGILLGSKSSRLGSALRR